MRTRDAIEARAEEASARATGGGLLAWASGLSVVALCAAGCAPGGGGGSATASGQAAVSTQGGIASNHTQWQTAMQALAGGPTPVAFEPGALAAYNAVLARTWPRVLPRLQSSVLGLVPPLLAQQTGPVRVLSIRSLTLDALAPPTLRLLRPGPDALLELRLPAAPSTWGLSFTAEVGGSFPVTIFGVSQTLHLTIQVDAQVRDVRVYQPVQVDLRDPDRPRITAAGTPTLQLRLALSSPDPLFSTVLQTLTQVLDPLVRAALVAGALVAQQQLGVALQALPQGAPWGVGGPAPVASGGRPADLEALSVSISDELQRNHMPFGQVFVAVFDQPDQGGAVVRYRHHGDTVWYTGAYLASEAYRYELTGDPRALAGMQRVLSAFDLLLHVSPTGDGLMVRVAVPLRSPHSTDIQAGATTWFGSYQGEAYTGYGAVSRDVYTGMFLGLAQTYLRVPSVRAQVSPLVTRAVSYLESHDWVVYRQNGGGVSVIFAQAPAQILAFSKLAALVDPGQFGAAHRRYQPLSSLLWFNAWASALDIFEGYYKFELGHTNLITLTELETDPTAYRGCVQSLRILRRTVGHHDNSWFDAAYAMIVPTVAAQQAPRIERQLQSWARRPRRGFRIQNSLDPNILTAQVTVSLPNQTGSPTQPPVTQPRTYTVAVHPLPIEKRVPGNLLWAKNPFELDGSVDRHEQYDGVDLLLPYWLGRSHGFLQ